MSKSSLFLYIILTNLPLIYCYNLIAKLKMSNQIIAYRLLALIKTYYHKEDLKLIAKIKYFNRDNLIIFVIISE